MVPNLHSRPGRDEDEEMVGDATPEENGVVPRPVEQPGPLPLVWRMFVWVNW